MQASVSKMADDETVVVFAAVSYLLKVKPYYTDLLEICCRLAG